MLDGKVGVLDFGTHSREQAAVGFVVVVFGQSQTVRGAGVVSSLRASMAGSMAIDKAAGVCAGV